MQEVQALRDDRLDSLLPINRQRSEHDFTVTGDEPHRGLLNQRVISYRRSTHNTLNVCK